MSKTNAYRILRRFNPDVVIPINEEDKAADLWATAVNVVGTVQVQL